MAAWFTGILPAINQAVDLCHTQNDDAAPYTFKYAAADLLSSTRQQLSEQTSINMLELQVAAIDAKRGCILLETDLLHDGEPALLSALPVLQQHASLCPQLLQESCNSLAALYSSREELQQALEYLKQAEQIYLASKPSSTPSKPTNDDPSTAPQQQVSPTADDIPQSSSPPSPSPPSHPLSSLPSETLYTQTLFYLAQVHGHTGQKQQSASYCAATLNRQLIQGSYDFNDWVQNCLQLSGFYLSQHDFAAAQYCVLAVRALLQSLDQQQHSSSKGKQQQEQSPLQQQQDLEHNDQQPQQQEQEQAQQLDADVAANVEIAEGKLYGQRLAVSHKVHVEQQQEQQLLQLLQEGDSEASQQLRFESLPLPQLAELPHGEDALAADFEAARSLFNAALLHHKRALEYYKLDGWVSEHIALLMDISNLYRCLAGFEADAHRACVMHKQRAKLLEPLVGQLSSEHYLGLVRSISLELAHVYRSIAEIKGGSGREPDKVRAAARQAALHYEEFLGSFGAASGQLPKQVEADSEAHYLRACFSLGRMAAKMDPGNPKDAPRLQAAYRYLMHGVEYAMRHQVAEQQQEAALAEQMAGLLLERTRLAEQAAELASRK